MRQQQFLRFIANELRATLRDPSRVGRVTDPRARTAFIERAKYRARGVVGGSWGGTREGSLRHRQYDSYEHYVQHQAAKRAIVSLGDYDERLRTELTRRLSSIDLPTGASALCLGARNGGEVLAMIDLGLFAVGVDLNPDPDSRVVVRGDFNALQWADRTVDIIYSNSFDHALNLGQVATEASRVLAREGRLVVDFMSGTEQDYTGNGEPGAFGAFESTSWARIDDAIEAVEKAGFTTIRRSPITFPWPGEMVEFMPRLG